ncbi:hypothetical protein Q8A67_005690 [Cirrhinus molitorella]|nr:hypothetical protein Q8A67_005690 [Cirrhinus molitorella]
MNGMFGPKTLSAKEGEYFGLYTEILLRKEDQVQWSFEGKILATGMNRDLTKTSYGDDERFRDRIELDHRRGDLLFTKAKTSDTGVYHLEVSSCKRTTIHREYTLTVLENTENESETVEIPVSSQEDVGGVDEQEMMS